jgi:hypothetical protein
MSKRGVAKEVSARIFFNLLAHIALIPIVVSLVRTYGESINVGVKSQWLESVIKLCDLNILTDGCDEARKEFKEIKYTETSDYYKNWLKALPFDFGSLIGQKWDTGDQKIPENYFFYTYWDDIINGIYEIVQNSPFFSIYR